MTSKTPRVNEKVKEKAEENIVKRISFNDNYGNMFHSIIFNYFQKNYNYIF